MITEEVFYYRSKFLLESGKSLSGFHLKYTTSGTLNPKKDNVVWVCHALTGSHEFYLWWEGLFGEGKVYDPKDYYVICANALGGCNGSTGPLEKSHDKKDSFYHDFPQISNRDIAASFDLLREHLGFSKIHTLIGGSLGGQHALEWSIVKPTVFEHLILLATNVQHSPWGIAFNEAQRMAIATDPTWTTSDDNAGIQGMRAARAIALLSYRNYGTYVRTQSEESAEKLDDFRASSYQQYQGEKLTKRFNAFTYWYLSKAMDSHNVARGRKSLAWAMEQIVAKTLVMGIDSDVLFPIEEQRLVASLIRNADFKAIHSPYGHDGFLIEFEAIAQCIQAFYSKENHLSSLSSDNA